MPHYTKKTSKRTQTKSPKHIRLPLDEGDLAKCREWGLLDSTILANGICTDRKADAMSIPYRNLAGQLNGYRALRPHKPSGDRKYILPKGKPNKAYLPAESCARLQERNSKTIIVTEGYGKALALDQAGYTTIGVNGVWGWVHPKSEPKRLNESFAEIDWANTIVYLVYDYDEKPTTRTNVASAGQHLAKALRTAGARQVFWVNMPPGPDGSKQGADDFLVANGAKAFRQLLDEAAVVESPRPEPLRKAKGRTDAANAARLVYQFGHDFRWIGSWDKFIIWDGKRWKLDSELQIELAQKNVAKALWREYGDEAANGKHHRENLNAMQRFVSASNNVNGIKASVALVKSERGVPIGIDELDSDPWLLNVENGTLDLRTGDLREHNRADFLTKLSPIVFDPQAQCPTWLSFIDQIFAGNADLIGYVQRLIGYSLTGVTEEHILPFAYGVGANGKSTLFETCLRLLGTDYSMKAPPDLLMAKRGESHPTERADLYGKRLVACIETEGGRRMAESLVKEITGGDRVRARRMREDFWEFAPTHHVWLSSNHKPVVQGTDHGIWRRIKLIPFTVVIPDDQQDKKLPGKLRAELSGILNWALEGCLDWQRNGLQEPDTVRSATSDYSTEMDELGQFLDSACEISSELEAPATRLYQAFIEESGSRMSQKVFGTEMQRRGYESIRFSNGPNKAKKGWKGLRLIADEQVTQISAQLQAKKPGKKRPAVNG
jgi:putative DNA primase/helicase